MTVEFDTSSLAKMRHELELFAPDLKKELDKRLRVVARSIVSEAKSGIPNISGKTAASYRVKRKARGDDLVFSAIGGSASSAIIEFAQNGRTNQGRSLVATLTARYGSPGRNLWKAYDRQNPPQQVQQVVTEVSREFESRVRRF